MIVGCYHFLYELVHIYISVTITDAAGLSALIQYLYYVNEEQE